MLSELDEYVKHFQEQKVEENFLDMKKLIVCRRGTIKQRNKSTLEKDQADIGVLQDQDMRNLLDDIGKEFCLDGGKSQEVYEDEKVIKEFMEDMAMTSDDQVLLKVKICGKVTTLKYEQLEKLYKNKWLNNNIINFSMDLMEIWHERRNMRGNDKTKHQYICAMHTIHHSTLVHLFDKDY